MRGLAILLLWVTTGPAVADIVIATRTIKAQTPIAATDVALAAAESEGAATSLESVIGQEARVTIYAGRPVMVADVGAPAMVERNQIVRLAFQTGGLAILTDGRALDRGAAGDVIRVMNLESKNTVSGLIDENGVVRVAPQYEGM